MRRRAAILSVLILSALGASAAFAGEAEEIAAINKAAASLDAAFAKDDVTTVRQMMTPGHIAVAPYYDGPQSVADPGRLAARSSIWAEDCRRRVGCAARPRYRLAQLHR